MPIKIRFFATSIFFIVQFSFGLHAQETSSDSIRQYFYTQTHLFPQEKIYAHIDRSSYLINDTIWFRTFLVDAQTHSPRLHSNFVYTELINSANQIVKRVKVKRNENVFSGFIDLDEELAAGNYQLRFYTTYMTSKDESYFFKRPIRIGNYMSAKYSCEVKTTFREKRNLKVELRFHDKTTSQTVMPDKLFVYDKDNNQNNVSWHNNDSTVGVNLKDSEKLADAILIEYHLDGYTQKEYIHIPKNENDFDITFFPEGGNLLSHTVNKVAYKAVNPSGLGEDITGYIINTVGDTLSTFQSSHLGMGVLILNGNSNQSLFALCRNAAGMEKRFTLPKFQERGLSLKVDWRKDNLYLSINKPRTHTLSQKLYLVIHCRGTVLYSEAWNNQKETVFFASSALPSGTLHALLLDENFNPVSERLVFNRSELDMTASSFSTQKSDYTLREHVVATVSATDMEGRPLQGSVSVSVTDNDVINPNNPIIILSTLLLTSDLQGHIEYPANYFTEGQENRVNLDLLMLTQGWRRYDVSKIIRRDYEYSSTSVEVNQQISGSVLTGFNKNRAAKSHPILLLDMDNGKTSETETDNKGRFVFNNLSFPDNTRFMVQAKTPSVRNRPVIEVDNDLFVAPQGFMPFSPQTTINSHHSEPHAEDDFFTAINQKSNTIAGMRHYQLQEVVVTGSKKEKLQRASHWASSDFSNKITSSEIEQMHPSSMMELLMLTPGLGVIGDQAFVARYYNGASLPNTYILVDGVETLSQHLNSISPQSVQSVEVLKEPESFVLGANGINGAIIITTKLGHDAVNLGNTDNLTYITPLGYQINKQFYSPKYDTVENNKKTDERTTIYWNPNIKLSNDGKASFSFYTSDSNPDYTVIIEGITDDGRIIHQIGAVN